MAVALPRETPVAPRRPTAPRPVERAPKRQTRPRSNAIGRKATIHRAAPRAAVGGRLAPLRTAGAIAVVGVILSLAVYLHVASLHATMQAGALRSDVVRARAATAAIQAQTEQLLADGRVERAAAAYGMVLVPSDALRSIRVAAPKAQRTG